MIFEWESQEAQLLKFIRIPAKKKLEWLRKMHEFTLRFSSKERKRNFWKIRECK